MARSNPDTQTGDESPTDPPAFDPRAFDAPAYEDIESHDDLIQYSKAYFAVVVAHYDLAVDASHVRGWDVSTRAKRRAAAVKTVDLSALGVLTVTGVSSPDWDALRGEYNDSVQRRMEGLEDVKDVRVVLTWGAFEAFDEAEWRATIRHEAIHVEQFHQYGDGGHGVQFAARAAELDASGSCPRFEDYDYPFECRACGEDAGGRYRESKAVEFARLSPSEQDEWIAEGRSWWETDCCEAPVTLAE